MWLWHWEIGSVSLPLESGQACDSRNWQKWHWLMKLGQERQCSFSVVWWNIYFWSPESPCNIAVSWGHHHFLKKLRQKERPLVGAVVECPHRWITQWITVESLQLLPDFLEQRPGSLTVPCLIPGGCFNSLSLGEFVIAIVTGEYVLENFNKNRIIFILNCC